ncbi:cytochrome c550 [Thalassobacillus hwangdonensis]|uniref:Cytochrome c550 n=1 Tax=Thalassobacillus hwangdonensis TaxID=546108 RepID=A0ABW3KZ14_9BACI
MRRNPLIPFGIIAVLGILTMFVLGWVGTSQHEAIQNGGEETEQASSNPEDIFQNNCSSCHGADLSGANGPSLKTIGSKYSKDEIQDIIINGKGQAMPAGLVPAEEASILAEWLAEKK